MTKKRQLRSRRKISRPVLILGLLIGLAGFGFLGLKCTENGVFTVLSVSEEGIVEQGVYKHFLFAQFKMDSLEEMAYIQREDQKVVAISEGFVNLHTKSSLENTLYTIDGNEVSGYTNGAYGADALYLDTSADGRQALMQISGVKAWVSIEDIQLYLFDVSLSPSYYFVKENVLYHFISTDLLQGNGNTISLDQAPDFMEEGTVYYSYDGNYFYTDFSKMSDDVRNTSHENAINPKAYYNFYQYVPHRSNTHLTSSDYDSFLTDAGIDQSASSFPCADNQSVLLGTGNQFIAVQEQTGINASMMFATAINESGYGQSEYAIVNHNLFGHAAYDSSPDSATVYPSIQDCIYEHAYGFLQNGYANLLDSRYHGSWFGNKASGINVQYASDPYWGEKASHFYYELDARQDFIDAKTIKIYTFQVDNQLPVLDINDPKTTLYYYEPGDLASFVLLDQITIDQKEYAVVASEMPVENGQVAPQSTYHNAQGLILWSEIQPQIIN